MSAHRTYCIRVWYDISIADCHHRHCDEIVASQIYDVPGTVVELFHTDPIDALVARIDFGYQYPHAAADVRDYQNVKYHCEYLQNFGDFLLEAQNVLNFADKLFGCEYFDEEQQLHGHSDAVFGFATVRLRLHIGNYNCWQDHDIAEQLMSDPIFGDKFAI